MTLAVHSPETELTSADSFLLDVLRGWKLLEAASLSKDEWRDILSATGNKLDFESVSNAFQIMWDEQLMRPRMASHNSVILTLSSGWKMIYGQIRLGLQLLSGGRMMGGYGWYDSNWSYDDDSWFASENPEEPGDSTAPPELKAA